MMGFTFAPLTTPREPVSFYQPCDPENPNAGVNAVLAEYVSNSSDFNRPVPFERKYLEEAAKLDFDDPRLKCPVSGMVGR